MKHSRLFETGNVEWSEFRLTLSPFTTFRLIVGLLLRLVRADIGDDHAAVRLNASSWAQEPCCAYT